MNKFSDVAGYEEERSRLREDPPECLPTTTTRIEHHSLPSPEEVRNNAAINNNNNGLLLPANNNRRLFLFISVSLVAIVAIVGFSAGIAVQTNRNNASPKSVAATSSQQSSSSPRNETVGDEPIPDLVDRLSQVQEYLSFVSSPGDLKTQGTPQYRAANWIADTDLLQLPVPTSQKYFDSFKFVQRYVISVFYYALGGDNWKYKKQTSFLSNLSECK